MTEFYISTSVSGEFNTELTASWIKGLCFSHTFVFEKFCSLSKLDLQKDKDLEIVAQEKAMASHGFSSLQRCLELLRHSQERKSGRTHIQKKNGVTSSIQIKYSKTQFKISLQRDFS